MSVRLFPDQRLAVLFHVHAAFAHPDHRSHRIGAVNQFRPITRERTALPVLAARVGADRRRWLRVLLPGRPNAGWIMSFWTRRIPTSWRLRADLGRRRLFVYRRGRRERTFRGWWASRRHTTPTGPDLGRRPADIP